MNIPTDQLSAFLLVHEKGSFTAAARELGLTQSALSQKVKRLEDALEAAVFIRRPSGPVLTGAGERLLAFARQQLSFEQEFLSAFHQGQSGTAGVVRVAGFSSVMRSVVIPALAPVLRLNPRLQVEFTQHEMGALPDLLKTNAADLILLDYVPALTGVEFAQLGQERYVVIEGARHPGPADVYLDHGPSDNATDSFFRAQGAKQRPYRRGFMGDVYAILDGVAQGLGRAVMSAHLVRSDKRVRQLKGFRAYDRPLVMVWATQGWYPKSQELIRETLLKGAAPLLDG